MHHRGYIRTTMSPPGGSIGKFNVLAPLNDFFWDGNEFSIPNLCCIKRSSIVPNLQACKKLVSELHRFDEDELQTASHWLVFKQSLNELLSEAEKINVFLLALWLSHPTRTQVRFRFELSDNSEITEGQTSSVARLLDRFQYIKTQVQATVETSHLEEASAYAESIRVIYAARQRLWNSLVLTLYGCTTIQWQVALICFSAAAEGILTYERSSGITERLAKSFACLVQSTKTERDEAYRAFVQSYGIRGDIMHGRAGGMQTEEKNLKELVLWSDLLRLLWKKVLTSLAIVEVLEKSDTERKKLFTQLEKDYQSPELVSGQLCR